MDCHGDGTEATPPLTLIKVTHAQRRALARLLGQVASAWSEEEAGVATREPEPFTSEDLERLEPLLAELKGQP